FVVGLTGRIENIELKKTSGSSRLDDAALDAMRASACKPYKENGEPVRAAYSQPFVFSLDD
ncbi:MAG: periplasmic protein TonB, partial [Caballeronia sp.]|nr:periplasmic protein TonB [Caballeronia sp.]